MIKILKNNIFNKKNRSCSLMILIIIGLIISISIVKYIKYNRKGIIINGIKFSENIINGKINVYIDGEVNRPGYIKVSKGATVEDAINKANGVTKHADIGRIDLTRMVQNKEKIVIPTIRENTDEESLNINQEQKDSKKVNINSATRDELTRLDGIGEKIANKIIEYRLYNRFNKIEDLIQIKGIGKSKFEKIKEDICV